MTKTEIIKMKRELIYTISIALFIVVHANSCVQSSKTNQNTVSEFEFSDSGFVWKSPVPDDSPFEMAQTFQGVYFTGRHSDNSCGDTFYPLWAVAAGMAKKKYSWWERTRL